MGSDLLSIAAQQCAQVAASCLFASFLAVIGLLFVYKRPNVARFFFLCGAFSAVAVTFRSGRALWNNLSSRGRYLNSYANATTSFYSVTLPLFLTLMLLAIAACVLFCVSAHTARLLKPVWPARPAYPFSTKYTVHTARVRAYIFTFVAAAAMGASVMAIVYASQHYLLEYTQLLADLPDKTTALVNAAIGAVSDSPADPSFSAETLAGLLLLNVAVEAYNQLANFCAFTFLSFLGLFFIRRKPLAAIILDIIGGVLAALSLCAAAIFCIRYLVLRGSDFFNPAVLWVGLLIELLLLVAIAGFISAIWFLYLVRKIEARDAEKTSEPSATVITASQ